MRNKGLSPLLSGVLYMAIILVGITIIMLTLYPKIKEIRKYSEISNTLDCQRDVILKLKSLTTSYEGSEEHIRCSINHGKLLIKDHYLLFVFPHVFYNYLGIFKGTDYSINDGVYVYDNVSYFLMGNKYIELNISKQNSFINLSTVINSILDKYSGKIIDGSSISITLNNDPSLSLGKGYVIAEKQGEYLTYGIIKIHVDNSHATYNLTLVLYPETDYFFVNVEN